MHSHTNTLSHTHTHTHTQTHTHTEVKPVCTFNNNKLRWVEHVQLRRKRVIIGEERRWRGEVERRRKGELSA